MLKSHHEKGMQRYVALTLSSQADILGWWVKGNIWSKI